MLKRLSFKLIIFINLLLILWFSGAAIAFENEVYMDKTKLVSQQINLLKDRLVQANLELNTLQKRQGNASIENVNKQTLNEAGLYISISKSNLDSVNIELSEAQQSIVRLEKEVQDIQNQLNAFNIFGMKFERNSAANQQELLDVLRYQQNLLSLEKDRSGFLLQLQKIASNSLQLCKLKFAHIDGLLKSQTILHLKTQQAKSELAFQKQQSYWLQRLNVLYTQLNKLDNKDEKNYFQLENEIFFANENANLTYLKMLIVRYQDQIQQLKVSIARNSSITFLNKAGDQIQILSKQITRLGDLLNHRITILEKRKGFLAQNNPAYSPQLQELQNQYQTSITHVNTLREQLLFVRSSLEQVLKQELSSRQGLPGFGFKAWWDLGSELWLVPTLTFEMTKNLSLNLAKAINNVSFGWWSLFLFLEIVWLSCFYFLGQFLKRAVKGVPDHEYGHINLKWLAIKLFHRTLVDIAVVGNIIGLFYFCGIPPQNFRFLMNLALICLFFKALITIARLCLVETLHDSEGHDVRLFHGLKWTLLAGGLITTLMVFVHQLPVIYEVKDLFDRLFLLFLLMVSVLLLKSWQVLPNLVLSYIDDKHTYLKRIIRLVGLIIPLVLLFNSAIGLFGYVNFIQTIFWYESIFLLVLIGYLSVRGMLNEVMQYSSQILIRHVNNGWLWTEAILKPLDRVLKVMLFFAAWIVLFSFYGWDKQSPVVEALAMLMNYRLFFVFNTNITLWNIVQITMIGAMFYWAARWSREFVYRMLLSRTKDLGIRNSIAILTQYSVIALGVFVCMRVLGIDFRALAVVTGAFALGIGLGLRDIFNNFVCGFMLLIERPLRVGDTVTINNYEGDVIHIGGRAVTIRTWDHMEVLVPNAEIFSKTFVNWTARDNIVRTVIDIKVNRHDQPHHVQKLIYDLLKANKDVLQEPATEVYLKELAEGMIEFEIRYYINLRQVKSRVGVKSEILMSIWEMFKQHSIEPPYPHHAIYLKDSVAMSSLPS